MSAKGGLIASIFLLVVVAAVQAGGWATTTIRDLPEYAVAGKPLRLTFMVRVHGATPLAGLMPPIEASSGTETVTMLAAATRKTGEYSASLVLPRPGIWTVEIDGRLALPALTVIAPGAPPPPSLPPAVFGQRLFVAKGCIDCHVNHGVSGVKNVGGIGPDLTGRRFPETYLTQVLTDPARMFSRDAEKEGWGMPKLELKKSEIAALAAFMGGK